MKKVLMAMAASCISAVCLYLAVSWIALTPLFGEVVSEAGSEPLSELSSNGIEYFRPCVHESSDGSSISWLCEDITRKTSFIWPGGGSMKIGLNNVTVNGDVVRKNYDIVEVICVFEDGRFKVEKVVVQP